MQESDADTVGGCAAAAFPRIASSPSVVSYRYGNNLVGSFTVGGPFFLGIQGVVAGCTEPGFVDAEFPCVADEACLVLDCTRNGSGIAQHVTQGHLCQLFGFCPVKRYYLVAFISGGVVHRLLPS